MNKSIKIAGNHVGKRLDLILSELINDVSRSQIKNWIEKGFVLVNEKSEKSSYKVKIDDQIAITLEPPTELEAIPEDIPIDIIYEDPDIVVVNKSADMVVHPAAGNPNGTLVNALLFHCKDLSGIGGVLRPGIVHRLDKGTTGIIVVAKSDKAHASLSKQFSDRSTKKIYYGLVYGVPRESEGRFDKPIGRHSTDRKRMSTLTRNGKEAFTEWKSLETFEKFLSYMRIRILTGRTHQIRVHFSAEGMALVGDDAYGGKRAVRRIPEGPYRDAVSMATRPMLHAASLRLTHPISGEVMTFEAELPDDFKNILEALREISE